MKRYVDITVEFRDQIDGQVHRHPQADLPLYDTGFDRPTGMLLDLFAAQIPIIANLEHLEQIDVDRAQLVVLPLKISGIGTVPCRAVLIIDR